MWRRRRRWRWQRGRRLGGGLGGGGEPGGGNEEKVSSLGEASDPMVALVAKTLAEFIVMFFTSLNTREEKPSAQPVFGSSHRHARYPSTLSCP